MESIAKLIAELGQKTESTRFSRLLKICESVFGSPRISGSHHIFKTPWPGDLRINLQTVKGNAKPYQVKQVIQALKKYQSQEEEQ